MFWLWNDWKKQKNELSLSTFFWETRSWIHAFFIPSSLKTRPSEVVTKESSEGKLETERTKEGKPLQPTTSGPTPSEPSAYTSASQGPATTTPVYVPPPTPQSIPEEAASADSDSETATGQPAQATAAVSESVQGLKSFSTLKKKNKRRGKRAKGKSDSQNNIHINDVWSIMHLNFRGYQAKKNSFESIIASFDPPINYLNICESHL